KTSELRFDRSGVFPLPERLDTIGILVHAVLDCAMVDQAMRGLGIDAPSKLATDSLAGLQLILPENIVMDDVQTEVMNNFLSTINLLEDAGVTLVRRKIPELDELKALSEAHGYIASAE